MSRKHKGRNIQQSMHALRVKRFAESMFGKKNTSAVAVIYAALVFIAVGWLPQGIADLVECNWQESCWLICSYKFLTSVAILGLFAWQLQRVSREDDKLEVKKQTPAEVKALGIFLSTIGKEDHLIQAEINRIERSLKDNTISMATFLDKQWEMPLIAIRYHQRRLETLYVFTSEGEKGSAVLMPVFKQVVESLYPSLKIEVLEPKGIDYEDVKQVFNKVETFYEMAKNDGYAENEIIIDVTGGQKPNTIAASIATLVSGRKFQYISTGSKEAFAYDVWYIDQVES
ncbi:MAG: hypothetical protein HGB36_10065 [Chlorobiaceae bacterium]|nr:hypothetical protein [Chlorobiaceae bacterium]